MEDGAGRRREEEEEEDEGGDLFNKLSIRHGRCYEKRTTRQHRRGALLPGCPTP
jgi:hypothetical protein